MTEFVSKEDLQKVLEAMKEYIDKKLGSSN